MMKHTLSIAVPVAVIIICLAGYSSSLSSRPLAQQKAYLFPSFPVGAQWQMARDLDIRKFPNGSINEGAGPLMTITWVGGSKFTATVTLNNKITSHVEGEIISGKSDIIYFKEITPPNPPPGQIIGIYAGRQIVETNNKRIQGSWYGPGGGNGDFILTRLR